jgi:DNA-binding CsgD family transcriptional regulator
MAELYPGFRAFAERVCTGAELAVLERMAEGRNFSQIAREFGVSPQAIHGRWTGADRKIREEVASLHGHEEARRS